MLHVKQELVDLEDLKLFAKNYSAIEEAAKKVYNEQLTA